MIRRETNSTWQLISQVRHAQLSADLAVQWSGSLLDHSLDELLTAIRHHDDGWENWPREKLFDPANGRPCNFTEMPMADATEIWSGSILTCERAFESPLVPLWISLHFQDLARSAQQSRQENAADLNAVTSFLQVQNLRYGRGREYRLKLADDIEVKGFHWLQFFDWLSLKLCCSPKDTEWEHNTPAGQQLQFTRLSTDEVDTITVSPYPFAVELLELAVTAKAIPARWYQTADEFVQAYENGSEVELHLRLQGATVL